MQTNDFSYILVRRKHEPPITFAKMSGENICLAARRKGREIREIRSFFCPN